MMNFDNPQTFAEQKPENDGTRFEELETNPASNPILQEAALEVLKEKDPDFFFGQYNGEVNADGYLLDRDGNPTSMKPSQCVGAAFMKEVAGLADRKIEALKHGKIGEGIKG